MELTQVYHDHEADALPQAAQPFGDYVARRQFYRPSMGRVLVHAERRGPAFQAANATTRLLTAINRGVFLDVIPAWTDLLAALNMTPSVFSVEEAYWPQMVEAVKSALLAGTGEDSLYLWASADEHVRGYATRLASIQDKAARGLQGDDDWADVDQARQDEIKHAYTQAARLRAFAKGAA